jgi:hypothetical protein
VDDGNSDYKKDTELVNVTKLQFVASIIYSLRKHRWNNYDLVAVPSIQSYILNFESLSESEQRTRSMELQ